MVKEAGCTLPEMAVVQRLGVDVLACDDAFSCHVLGKTNSRLPLYIIVGQLGPVIFA